MFYTKYRPQKFSELIGLDHAVSSITGAMAGGNPSHAYFFSGSRGIGKTTTARLIAKALNCENPEIDPSNPIVKFEPCEKCASCLAVKNGSHMDLIEIDAASNRGIDNIRELKDNVILSPSMGKNKIYIIDEVHMLTPEASNALLKTLEEPPAHAYFILCTTNPEKVVLTIKSRCQQFHLTRPTTENIVLKLARIAIDAKRDMANESLKKIAIAAKGAYREAETLLEQIISGDVNEDKLLASHSLNYFSFAKTVFAKSPAESIELIHKIYSGGENIEHFTEKFVEYLRSLLFSKLGVIGVDDVMNLTPEEIEFAEGLSITKLKEGIEKFGAAINEFRFAVVPTLPLELAAVELAGDGKENKEDVVRKNPSKPFDPDKKGDFPKGDKVDAEDSHKFKEKEVSVEFPYKELVERVKPSNHSIHLMMHSCDFVGFDGKNLHLKAYYSFHKERLMSVKVRGIIENAAQELTGRRIVLKCELSKKRPDAKKLTDMNVKPLVKKEKEEDVDEIFEKVFGGHVERKD